jgi:hypothetical protein
MSASSSRTTAASALDIALHIKYIQNLDQAGLPSLATCPMPLTSTHLLEEGPDVPPHGTLTTEWCLLGIHSVMDHGT